MELKKLTGRITVFFKKYRYVVIVLLIGIVFMCLPRESKLRDKDNIIEDNTPYADEAPALGD